MKNQKILLLICMLLLIMIVTGCAGTTNPNEEENVAFKVEIKQHTGDTGDIIKNNYGIITDTLNCYYGADSTFYELENNGIDAYYEGDWVLVQWRHVSDPETESLELFRFSYSDYQSNAEDLYQTVEFMPYQNNMDDYYIDRNNDLANLTLFYFIRTVHVSGAVAYSDTVGYRLINKPLLQEPDNLAEFSQTDSIVFRWDNNISSSMIKHRLLIFDEFYRLIWHYYLFSDDESKVNFTEESGFQLELGTYIWRVDGINEFPEYITIDGKVIEVFSGSESMERMFLIIP